MPEMLAVLTVLGIAALALLGGCLAAVIRTPARRN